MEGWTLALRSGSGTGKTRAGREGWTLALRGAGSEEEEEEGQGDGRAGGGVGDVSWEGITDHIRSGLLTKPFLPHSISVPLAGHGLPAFFFFITLQPRVE